MGLHVNNKTFVEVRTRTGLRAIICCLSATLFFSAIFVAQARAEDELLMGGDLLSEDDSLLGGDLLGGDLANEVEEEVGEELLDEDAISESSEPTPEQQIADEAHTRLLNENQYPTASQCAVCHESHYKEWSVSPHAYAQLSPVFNSMHAKIVKETNGTQGDFCIRCHTPVGMQMGEPIVEKITKRSAVSQEGVTCVVCHKIDKQYGKISGRFPVKEGDIYEPVYGPNGNEELRRVLEEKDTFKVVANREEPGRAIHADVIRFEAIETSSFCGACHDVTFVNGFRLEEAYSEHNGSPAAKRNETCQDCHMGKTPGVASGYRHEPAAVVGGVATKPRKRSNHLIAGPDYSIVHPGIFPHNPKAKELATIDEWTKFNHREDWGKPEYEANVDAEKEFPERWSTPEDRIEARLIVDKQLELLEEARRQRLAVLRQGYRLDSPEILTFGENGLKFRARVSNGTDGHNVPTGFIAERLVFVRAEVFDSSGKVVFASGDLDPNGDVRDSHSLYVHHGKLPLDTQLFSLQSNFIITANRGGDREQILALDHSRDPLIYTRPATSSSILRGSPARARIHRKGIEPNGERWAEYTVSSEELHSGQAPYTLKVQLIAGMVPVNLVDAIKDVGFDYGLSAKEVAKRVVEGHEVLWEYQVPIEQTLAKN